MTQNKQYTLGDIVQMKKEHPCKLSPYFEITRVGVDVKIKCQGCGAVIMMERQDFQRKLKKIISKKEEQ